jgi:hydroxylysine kinase
MSSSSFKKSLRDEKERKNRRPKITEEEALNVLNLINNSNNNNKKIKAINSYDDANFLIEEVHQRQVLGNDINNSEKKSKKYILKFHNEVDSVEPNRRILECQRNLMMHLLSSDNIVCSQQLELKLDEDDERKYYFEFEKNGNKHAVKMLTYIDGELLVDKVNSLSENEDEKLLLWHSVGNFVGRISTSFDKWNQQQQQQNLNCSAAYSLYEQLEKREHLWDVRNFMDVTYFLDELKKCGGILEKQKEDLANKVFDWFKNGFVTGNAHENLPRGVIHNDLNESNILLIKKKVGDYEFAVIDFGDICVSWKVIEIATAMAYCALASPKQPLEACEALLSGYNEIYTLNKYEIEVLPILVITRMITSLIMGLYSHHFKVNDDEKDENEYQDNSDYLLKSQVTGWGILSKFVNETPEKLVQKYEEIAST